MNKIAIPPSYKGEKLTESLDFIIEYDQWDDWVPDVIYLQDIADTRREYLAEVDAKRKGGAISLEGSYPSDIYSNSDLKFRTVTLPLAERVIITSIIASQADTVQARVPADRLRGFEYGPKKQSAAYDWLADTFGQ